MNIKLLIEHHSEFLCLKGGCTGLSESTLVKMPHCWKSHVAIHIYQGVATSAVPGWVLLNFEPVRDIMVVLVIYKNEDPVKNGGARTPKIFPIITLCELIVAKETRVLIRSGPKPYAVFP